jgi:hypothetical protein
MSNRQLTADVIAKEALAILDNEMGWLGKIHRAYEDEWGSEVNGYKKGDTISIRRPADMLVTDGATMNLQDVIEGKVTLSVDQQKHVAFSLSSSDLTLKIDDLSERVIKPAVISLVNTMAFDVLTTAYKGFWNWVGTPAPDVNSFADFYAGVRRLNEMAVPQEDRIGILSPADHAAMLGSNTALFNQGIVADAYRRGELGMIGGVDLFMSQLTPVHVTGTRTNSTPLTEGVSQNVTYDTAKDTFTQSLITDGWGSSVTLTAGDVFQVHGIYMVNPRTKASTGVLQQFVVVTAKTADETTSNPTTLTISPPIILSGPHQTVTFVGVSSTDELTITNVGTASTNYAQNLLFHKNAVALAMVPLAMPQGAVNGSRKSHKGLSIRVLPIYDGINDVSKWRMDILYGRKCIDGRLGTRLSGTSG